MDQAQEHKVCCLISCLYNSACCNYICLYQRGRFEYSVHVSGSKMKEVGQLAKLVRFLRTDQLSRLEPYLGLGIQFFQLLLQQLI